ncbi:rRNA adenine N-6-methyltransferase family protein [Candidatus Endowatersipora endosymbiont of Watersipora subatra]|uniref:rRNA adenine N-6-methyltransferase family protein n=1 Tax=Candidatus Endowatersipora endosymbiont of Watersipora subatra TaxID=3077946 RepID=UPI00312C944A
MSKSEDIVNLFLTLRGYGISDPIFLKAIESTPKEQFIPSQFYNLAWKEITIPIPCGQTIIPAVICMRLLDALEVQSTHSVLEVGTGTGFQTALLSRLAKKVYSVERYRTLVEEARGRFCRLNIQTVQIFHANALNLESDHKLYDRIITDLAFDEIPISLFNLLASNGVMITAIGLKNEEQMVVKIKKIGNHFEKQDLFPVRFSQFETGMPQIL